MTSAAEARGARIRAGTWRLAVELWAAAVLIAALGVFHVWSRTRVVAAGYTLGELQAEHARLVATHDQLRIEREMLTSPKALERQVRTTLSKLGMAPPDRGSVLAAGPGRPRDVPGRAGVDGVGDRTRPAEPTLPARPTRPAAAPAPERRPLALRTETRADETAALPPGER
jgi:hypothetical protein